MDRYILISADTHAGADVRDYKTYLESKWHAEFDVWAAEVEARQRMMREVMKGLGNVGVGGDPEVDANRNWDSERRLRELESDGVVASVLFPNTLPPFAPVPSSDLEAPKLSADDNERRWAGLRAHNRWLVDFCSMAPERRRGIAQISLGDVEGSVAEIAWAREQGLTGGVVLPGAPPGSGLRPLYAPDYEPIWAACEDHGMPVNHHAGGANPDFGPYFPTAMAMFIIETRWWSHRALWHLVFSGALERHPDMQLVFTETGSAWVPETLAELDLMYERMLHSNGSERLFGGAVVEKLSLKPSEYFARQCHLGASFLRPFECAMRHEIGIDRIMWGNDYPHNEASFPYTSEHLRLTFSTVDPVEVQQIVAGNAAQLYGFDLDALAPLAARFGPRKADVAVPLAYADVPDGADKCPAFAPENRYPLESVA
jgi:predicted TIM-barrel fold metal-dependent hydrolase